MKNAKYGIYVILPSGDNYLKTLKYWLKSLPVVILAFSISAYANAEQVEKIWITKTIKSFEAYCYRTFGKYEQIDALAKVSKLRPIPIEYISVLMGPDSTNGKGFFVEWDKDVGMFIMLAYSKPDACSINIQGISYANIKTKVQAIYQLVLAIEDDVGLQTTEMYVPGGKNGSKQEASDLGLVLITYPKSGNGVTLGYFPPETVKSRQGRNN